MESTTHSHLIGGLTEAQVDPVLDIVQGYVKLGHGGHITIAHPGPYDEHQDGVYVLGDKPSACNRVSFVTTGGEWIAI